MAPKRKVATTPLTKSEKKKRTENASKTSADQALDKSDQQGRQGTREKPAELKPKVFNQSMSLQAINSSPGDARKRKGSDAALEDSEEDLEDAALEDSEEDVEDAVFSPADNKPLQSLIVEENASTKTTSESKSPREDEEHEFMGDEDAIEEYYNNILTVHSAPISYRPLR
jgi:hypothetical protein